MSKERYLVLYYDPSDKEGDSYPSGIVIEAESHYQAERLWMDAIGYEYDEDNHRYGWWHSRNAQKGDTMQWMVVHHSEWKP